MVSIAMQIPLGNSGRFALVDEEDYSLAAAHCWHLKKLDTHSTPYATCYERRLRHVMLHRFILGCERGDARLVDHVNGDGLDNRRCNLRLATHSENLFNQRKGSRGHSQYKGVFRHHDTVKFQASIGHNGKSRYLGLFEQAEDAARAYDAAAIELHGEFARLNFPRAEQGAA